MDDWTNSARRLYVMLSSVLPGDQNESMLHVWTTAFDLTDSSEIGVSRYLIGMVDSLEDVNRLLSARPDITVSAYTKLFGPIREVLTPASLRHSRGQILTPHLTPEVMTRLEFCAEEVRRFYNEDQLSQDDLNEIRVEIEELIERITKSTVDEPLRMTLIEDLERMLVAVRLYRVQGAKALATVHRSILGAAVVHDQAITSATRDDKEVLVRLVKFLEKVEKSVSVATKIYGAVLRPTRFLLSLVTRKALENEKSEPPPAEDA